MEECLNRQIRRNPAAWYKWQCKGMLGEADLQMPGIIK